MDTRVRGYDKWERVCQLKPGVTKGRGYDKGRRDF